MTGTDNTAAAKADAMPLSAKWLGATGAIPFVATAIVAAFGPENWSAWAVHALAYYGAVILSFLGGIHWGLAISNDGTAKISAVRLCWSVVPSLIAWGALLLPLFYGLAVLTAAFGLALFVDTRAGTRAVVPSWFPDLRTALSVAVIASLLLGLFGAA
ncbi:DUF3429 domain-containing protein [Roseibium sp. MMSF_3412]|uniref:DUF3429 domain-containing protein n=1 Tax=Roseibium sp. MMSF_3412 TaxID=3046712 RepID=UPI00273FECBC|nr:DUF3429 domain-containing protein [Roseibium sp. MMSF_3412]